MTKCPYSLSSSETNSIHEDTGHVLLIRSLRWIWMASRRDDFVLRILLFKHIYHVYVPVQSSWKHHIQASLQEFRNLFYKAKMKLILLLTLCLTSVFAAPATADLEARAIYSCKYADWNEVSVLSPFLDLIYRKTLLMLLFSFDIVRQTVSTMETKPLSCGNSRHPRTLLSTKEEWKTFSCLLTKN